MKNKTIIKFKEARISHNFNNDSIGKDVAQTGESPWYYKVEPTAKTFTGQINK